MDCWVFFQGISLGSASWTSGEAGARFPLPPGAGMCFLPLRPQPLPALAPPLAPFGLDWLLPRRGGRQAVEYGVPAVRRRKARPAAGAAGVTGPGDGLIVAVGDAGNRAGLLEGHHIPLLVLEGLGDGDLPGASPGAVGFVGYFIIGIGPQILLCILPVGGQGAGAGVQISDDHIVAGTLRHLVEIVEAVHAEAVAQGQNAEGPALAEQGGPRAVRRPDPRRQQRKGHRQRQQQRGPSSNSPDHKRIHLAFPVLRSLIFVLYPIPSPKSRRLRSNSPLTSLFPADIL